MRAFRMVESRGKKIGLCNRFMAESPAYLRVAACTWLRVSSQRAEKMAIWQRVFFLLQLIRFSIQPIIIDESCASSTNPVLTAADTEFSAGEGPREPELDQVLRTTVSHIRRKVR